MPVADIIVVDGDNPAWLLLDGLLDARVLSALALLLAARLSGNLLVAMGVGAAVLLLR